MEDYVNKTFAMNLRFGTWQNQVWLMCRENADESDFQKVLEGLDEVGEKANNSNDFFSRAITYFSDNGFVQVQK